MQLEVGAVFEGKVTGVTKFGAFVAMPTGQNGLVHISEIANSYVNDINDFVKVGDSVKVKVISIKDGKTNLSIKRAQEPQQDNNARQAPRPFKKPEPRKPAEPRGTVNAPTGDEAFEDKLKKFMQESDSRIAGNPMYADRNKGRRRR